MVCKASLRNIKYFTDAKVSANREKKSLKGHNNNVSMIIHPSSLCIIYAKLTSCLQKLQNDQVKDWLGSAKRNIVTESIGHFSTSHKIVLVFFLTVSVGQTSVCTERHKHGI